MAVLQTLQLHNLPLLKFATDWCSSTNLPRFDDTNYATGGDLPSLFAVLAVSLTLLPPSRDIREGEGLLGGMLDLPVDKTVDNEQEGESCSILNQIVLTSELDRTPPIGQGWRRSL